VTGLAGGYAIRRATPADAGLLARLAAATFTEAFGHLYPREDLEAFLALAYSEPGQARLIGDPAQAAWLLEHDGEPVGHAAAGPCALPHPDVAPGDGELKRLYVLRAHQGGGRGTRLCGEVLDWLLADGPRTLWVGVWSENPGAQRLYARHGFERVGEYEFPVGRVRDREFILRRPAGD
jgi:ribosomal protein S18 acetylase RimI-like enzyme